VVHAGQRVTELTPLHSSGVCRNSLPLFPKFCKYIILFWTLGGEGTLIDVKKSFVQVLINFNLSFLGKRFFYMLDSVWILCLLELHHLFSWIKIDQLMSLALFFAQHVSNASTFQGSENVILVSVLQSLSKTLKTCPDISGHISNTSIH
jgi:hypothetical protein